MRGALWNKHLPGRFSNLFGRLSAQEDFGLTLYKGMFRMKKIEVSEKIFELNFT
jgi:hypothetical protein